MFDFPEDIYGNDIQVEFCHKLCNEKRYDSFDELKLQIFQDAEHAKDFFQNHG